MHPNNFLKHFFHLIWIFDAVLGQVEGNYDNFVPMTQQPLLYFPQPRIVGGKNAEDNQFPYQTSLRLFNRHICGASIISNNFVVTAAHCVSTASGNSIKKMSASILTIQAGSRLINSGGIIIGVSQVIIHPSYKNFNNDIAVLKLNHTLEFNEKIQPIGLATQSLKEGVKVFTTGWGRLMTNGPTPQILQYNILVSITNTECSRRIGHVPTSVLCLAHTVGNGVCSGDSGGPAIYNNQLVGITNFIVGGCGSNAPDGYASVYYFASWIRSEANLK